MGGALEKLLEKARKEPEKYRDLLLEEKHSLEADLRYRFSWTIAIAQLEIAYIGLFRVLKVDLTIVVIVSVLLMAIAITLSASCLLVERMIKRVREILYGDPMSRWEIIFAMIYAIVCGIIAIILALMG
ncbi:MAG: hypothetical protein DRM97_08575 [Thermoprotei archaeon]|nr:MAG: hypothetical protein DRM97_08575 [Thermoprotei archaeon]